MIFKRRQITPYFLGSLLDLILVCICLFFSVKNGGNISLGMGIFNLLLMAGSCVLCVLGMMELSYWREEKRRLGVAGAWIYTFVFVALVALYLLGVFYG